MKVSKGSAFERHVCKELSLWWTKGKGDRDNIFWRTSASGGRATIRSKRGKTTPGQYGDICAVDLIGKPLLDVFTFELKRGYNRFTIQDMLDKPRGAVKQEYEKWIEQAENNCDISNSLSWLIIFRRDRRETMVLAPEKIEDIAEIWGLAANSAYFQVNSWQYLWCFPLETFFELVSPSEIIKVSENLSISRKP